MSYQLRRLHAYRYQPLFHFVSLRRILPELRAAGKAVIVISHDDRYFDAADRIIRLESGRMTDQGVAS